MENTAGVIDKLKLSGGRVLPLKTSVVMGILNVTPDSFSDGGKFIDPEVAVEHALRMEREGAAIIDVGAESTRPGSVPVDTEEQIRRLLPVIKGIRQKSSVAISVDSTDAEVVAATLECGADIINDISAGSDEKMFSLAAEKNVPIVLMHMQGMPENMQDNPQYNNVVNEVRRFLQERVKAAVNAGVRFENIILDPGFGFGKTVEHNLQLMAGLDKLKLDGLPVLVGFSRKSTIGAIVGSPVEERLGGSIAMAVMGLESGGSIFRVHDVKETYQALRVAEAVLKYKMP
jgi:dihydropteroate synthase